MVYEVQKLFLLPDDLLLQNLKRDGVILASSELELFYTHISPSYEVKFQNINGNCSKITQFNDKILEQIQEEKISRKDYEKARKKLIERSIKKRTYEFKICFFRALIDVYDEPRIHVLSIFFPTLDMARIFFLPKDFGVEREISENLNLKNIILFGFEYLQMDIDKCLKIIEKNQNFTLAFPHSLLAFDGYRIFLFYLFRKLKFYWNLALENKKRECFFDFFSYSRKIYIILLGTEGIFDEELSKNLASKFEFLIHKSHYIDDKSNENLLLFLGSENLQNLFSDFDFFIKQGFFYKGMQQRYFFKQIIARRLRKTLVLFKKTLLKCSKFETLEANFFELCIFLEYFHHFFNIKDLAKLYNKYFIYHFDKKIFLKINKKKQKLSRTIYKASKKLKIYEGY